MKRPNAAAAAAAAAFDRVREVYAENDANTPEREMYRHETKNMRCNVCNFYASPLVGGYAFTRDDPWVLFGCRCPRKYLWVKMLKSEQS